MRTPSMSILTSIMVLRYQRLSSECWREQLGLLRDTRLLGLQRTLMLQSRAMMKLLKRTMKGLRRTQTITMQAMIWAIRDFPLPMMGRCPIPVIWRETTGINRLRQCDHQQETLCCEVRIPFSRWISVSVLLEESRLLCLLLPLWPLSHPVSRLFLDSSAIRTAWAAFDQVSQETFLLRSLLQSRRWKISPAIVRTTITPTTS
mmetsp:Transcript_29839/g.32503  ORF Transcript_29839/g.32503 Transcript_29839/m.32503 type:complete len:203 (+) Transcript_29839:2721-3329(+)